MLKSKRTILGILLCAVMTVCLAIGIFTGISTSKTAYASGGEISTIADVLATNTKSPTSYQMAWDNENGKSVSYVSGEILFFQNKTYPTPVINTLSTNASVTQNGNNYEVTVEGRIITFEMDSNVLVSITVSNATDYLGGKYIAPHIHGEGTDAIKFTSWTSNNSLPETDGNYVLTCDVTLSSTWEVPEGTTNLCLNGYVIKANCTEDNKFSVITVGEGATLNLYDCDTTTTHNGYVDSTGLWHLGTGEGTAKAITGGVITGGSATGSKLAGGGVYVDKGDKGVFNMYGGTIAGNEAKNNGGGVSVGMGSSFTMSAGEIKFNKASNGGGVYNNSATFEMTGGIITENTATYGGGFMMYGTGCSCTLGGTAQITGNTVGAENNKTTNNVYLPGKTITLGTDENAPTTMSVGITLQSGTGKFTVNGTADDVAYFFSDSDSYKVCFNAGTKDAGDEYLELKNIVVEIDCPTCGGDGYTDQQCQVCYGFGAEMCEHCDNTFKEPCTNCNKIGKISFTTLEDAIKAVANNGKVILLADNSEEIEISKEIVFTVDKTTFTFDKSKITAGTGYEISKTENGTETTFIVTLQKTVASILPDGFPVTAENGWINEYLLKAYLDNETLYIGKVNLPVNTLLTKDESNYIYSCFMYDVKFVMTQGTLTSIEVSKVLSGDANGIFKAVMKIEKPTADETVFVYDGQQKTYTIATNDAYTVSDNTTQTNAGEYVITVSLKNAQYKWVDGTTEDLTFEFVINQRAEDVKVKDETGEEITDSKVMIVSGENGIKPGAVIVVEVINLEKTEDIKQTETLLVSGNKIAENEKIYGIYDVKLLLDGVSVQPNGKITIKMFVPKELCEKDFKLYHIHNGTELMEIDNYTDVGDGYIKFDVDKLSQFAFVGEAPNESHGLSAGAIVAICIGAVVLLLIVAYVLGYFFLYRKGKLDDKKIKVIYKFLPKGNDNK